MKIAKLTPPATRSKQKSPRLNDFTEDEDTTVRLADLFAELESGK
jgi:hypothetical protein